MAEPHTTSTYSSVRDALRTGDVFLAHGDSAISEVVELIEWGMWSHSGMVIRASDIGLHGLPRDVLLWESTRSTNLPDVVTGSHKNDPAHPGGTLLVDLESRLEYDISIGETPVCFRSLQAERTPEMLASLADVLDSEIRSAYFPTDLVFGINWFKGHELNRPPHDFSSFFCSELLAYTLQHIGILGTDYVPNWYEPTTFSVEHTGPLPFLAGASLGPEVWVTSID